MFLAVTMLLPLTIIKLWWLHSLSCAPTDFLNCSFRRVEFNLSFLCKQPSVRQTAFAAVDHKSLPLGRGWEREKCFRCTFGGRRWWRPPAGGNTQCHECLHLSSGLVCHGWRAPCEPESSGVSEQVLNAARPLATCTPPHLHADTCADVVIDAADLSDDCKSLMFFPPPPPQVCRLGSRRSWRPAPTPPVAPMASSGASPSPASARCRSAALGEETFS